MSNPNPVNDITIIGAGPTGLALAAELHRLGRKPLIVDHQVAGANTSRAAVVHARTLEVLEPLDIVQDLQANGVIVPIFRLRDRDRVLLEADFRTLDTAYPFTLMCPQNRTEAILLNRLEELGGLVQRPLGMTGAQTLADGIEVELNGAADSRKVKTRWLVGCDGAHSIVRETFGIPFDGGSYRESFILADVRMEWPIPRDEVTLFFSPDGLVVIAPLPGDRFRVVATVDEAPEQPGAEFVEAILRDRGFTGFEPHISETVWSSRFHIHHRVARTPLEGNVVLCGDAAHVHSPAGGQGMNTGVQDAVSLASALDQALTTGQRHPVEAWARKRHAIAEDVVQLTDRMTRAATLQSAVAQKVRNALITLVGHLPHVPEKIARQLAELDNR